MRRITIVRHGEAAAGWSDQTDPGLSDLGRDQAGSVAEALGNTPVSGIVTSPLRRCRETAAALADRLRLEPTVDDRVAEIPSPELTLDERGAWLRTVMAGTWIEAGGGLQTWRDGVVEAICAMPADTVVFSHYIALNAVVGSFRYDDRVVCFHPDNCSATVIDADERTVLELGGQAPTVVN